jgi:hypothetical protein
VEAQHVMNSIRIDIWYLKMDSRLSSEYAGDQFDCKCLGMEGKIQYPPAWSLMTTVTVGVEMRLSRMFLGSRDYAAFQRKAIGWLSIKYQ